DAARRHRRGRAVPRALQRAERAAHLARLARLLGDRRQPEVGDRRAHPGAPPPFGTATQRRACRHRAPCGRDGVRAAPSSRAGRLMQDRPRARATSNATAEGRSLVRVEAAAGLAAVMTGAVALLDAARWPVLLAPRGLIDRRTDHEREVDAGEIHETERSERMAERLLRGQV